MGFPYDDIKYSIVNRGAHRKPAPRIGAPGLSQHFAFRLPDGISKLEWHRAIDYFLLRMFFVLWDDFSSPNGQSARDIQGNVFKCPNLDAGGNRLFLCRHHAHVNCTSYSVDDSDDGTERQLTLSDVRLRSVRYDVFSIETLFMGLHLSVKADIRNEYWTLTFLADLSRLTARELERQQQIDIKEAFQALGNFCIDNITKSAGQLTMPRLPLYRERELYKTGEIFYTSFWSLLNSEIIEKCENGFPHPWINLGTTFADFRGVAVGISVTEPSTAKHDLNRKYVFQFLKATPADQHIRRTIQGLSEFSVYDNTLALQVTDLLWPAVKEFLAESELGVPAREEGGKREITVTRFQKGRSLYISSLGRLN